LAAGAHLSGIFFPLLGPLAFCLFCRKDRYVGYHALHALIGTLLLNLFLFTVGAISLAFSVASLWNHYQNGWKDFSLWQVLIKSAVTWIILALIGLANTALNLFQAWGAYQGKLPRGGLTTILVNRITGRERAALGDA